MKELYLIPGGLRVRAKALRRSRGRGTGAEKSAEDIVADLGGEGPNQSTDAGNGIAWAGREGKETPKAR